jgi:hypothetical protein
VEEVFGAVARSRLIKTGVVRIWTFSAAFLVI